MTFESLYIGSFGKLSDVKFDFSDGVNIIEGVNESGKSTVCAFIRFMFYGLPSGSEEKMRCISWRTSNAVGSLTFSDAGVRYRIEREAVCATSPEGKNVFREKCTIYDANTNLVCFKGQNPGEVFFGVSGTVFESTVYIRQTADSKVGGHELGDEAENILFSANESINTKKAIAGLDSARVFLMHKRRDGGKIVDLKEERDALEEKLSVAMQTSGDIIYNEGTRRQIAEKKEESEERLAIVRAELEQYERYTMKKAYLRRKSEKARLAETEEKIAALRTPPEHGGIDISADDYIAALEGKQSELERASSRYAHEEEELSAANQKLNDMSGKLAIFERFGAKKGAETREELIGGTRHMRRASATRGKIAVLCFVLAVISFITTAILYLTMPNLSALPKIAALVAAIVAAGAGFWFMSQANALKRKVNAICQKFGCNGYAEFEELVKASSEDEAYMVFITDARDEANDKFTAASEALEAVSSDILALLRHDGFGISENTATSLAEALAVCRAAHTEIAGLESAAAEQRRRIDEIAETLSAYPTDYLKAACLDEYDEEAMEAFNLTAKRKEQDFLTSAIAQQTERIHQLEVELSALYATSLDPTELAEQKNVLDGEIERLTAKWNAYMLAIEAMESASGKLREGISPKIAGSAAKLMSAMTDGKYSEFGMDMDFGLSYSDGVVMRDAAFLSAGTGDMAYLCLRIALIELLYQKSVPPFLFDESFVRMDDRRLSRVLTLLSKYADRHYQTILFTCHAREKELMKSIGACRILSI